MSCFSVLLLGAGQTCMSCSKVPNPVSCNHVTVCKNDEVITIVIYYVIIYDIIYDNNNI